ncbi:lysophospholipase precursor [Purpureocillium lavendulum]|uniref:Lysophospholipase n=1 Tax=Purpureocillium lavendulum TaxID=1247861 RepID=A0AB34FRN1_9HYPO|nr:lysophospholipase precursor [Purpureocillium lavendulum]
MAVAGSLTLLLAATALSPAVAAAATVKSGLHPAAAVAVAPVLDARLDDVSLSLEGRATNQSPQGYTPSSVNCPSQRPQIRNGSSLSPQEKAWLPKRRNETIPHIRSLLKRIAIPGFDSEAYLKNVEKNATALPNIGLAVSGGGYRAMLNGAGALAAWDDRSDGSQTNGNLGGLLQSATYLSGLSGGGWLVGSIYTNNFTSVQDAVNSPSIWVFDDSILQGPEQYSLLQYYRNILDAVEGKDKAGYDRSITDYWGRMLSYQLINATDGGPGFTFSSIADDEGFSSGKTPLPFLIADGRAPGQTVLSSNSTIFEFSPWELGSSDPTLEGFVPLKYVGSKFNNGSLPSSEKCIAGFDNAGFVMGTSSSLFNQIVLYLKDGNSSSYVPSDVPKFIVDALTTVLEALGDSSNDIADWTPNPFKGWNTANNPGAGSERLTLVDGGEDLQNVPYHPHILQERKVDVVFSIDSSADTQTSWPDGASAIATYERSLEKNISAGTGFPAVPGKDTFLNLGLNTKPVFFGCNSTNQTSPSPLIVYIPNYPYIYASNISTFQMSIKSGQRDAIIENGWAVATQLNGTRDADWPVCVGCAMLSRSFERTRTSVPAKCQQCFTRYCWDGTLNETKAAAYDPKYYSTPIEVKSAASGLGAPSAVALSLAALMGFALVL